ncbi:MAG: universal stress protein [Pseudomonadota bacterium]
MAYPTILVHVDDGAHSAGRIRLATHLAQRVGGHLIGAAPTGVSRFLDHSMPLDNDALAQRRAQARAALAAFGAQCDASRLPSFEARFIDDEASAGLNLHGRAAELLVLGQDTPEVAARVIKGAGRPVLLVPANGPGLSVGRQILVAWDGGREAARALQLALPLLKDANRVDIALLEVAGAGQRLTDALATDPRPWLARHGVQATLTVHAREHGRQRRHQVGERLLGLALDQGADLLVMGAYGQTRFREPLLGGVTRSVIQAMTLPVLLAH